MDDKIIEHENWKAVTLRQYVQSIWIRREIGRVPDDGDPVVAGFAPVGRVTSSRLSPTLGKGFGFAWVPIELAKEGRVIHIRVDGRILPAEVTLKLVYDPEGLRLRE